jgi:uncharacterized protein (TIGR02145 family)
MVTRSSLPCLKFLKGNFDAMKNINLFFYPALICLLLFSLSSFSEGSKEIYIGTHNTSLFLCNDFVGHCNQSGNGNRTQFSIYGCEETSRLYFVTANTNEIVYIGFNPANIPGNSHGVFRIKNQAGTIVYSETAIPTTGTGFITNITEARNGPFQLYGTGGYSAIDWHPPAPDTYYIEFQEVNTASGNVQTDNDGFNMNLFDLTVYDSISLQTKLGRLYSKAWQFQENNHYSGTNYVYSVDSIITSAAFNDMQGGVWVQFCNQWGCANTGIFPNDRKSLYHQQAYMPQYMEFLNPPDSVLFPHGVMLGQIVPPDPWGERNCNDGSVIFHITVNKSGNVEIDLSFPVPYTTRVLTATVISGTDLITWDGKDGSGVNVPNNVLVTFTVKYVNGLTNLPLYDVEGNPNGFIVGIVAPSGSTPLVYWDDTNILGPPAGTTNLTGCLSPPGCHTWSGSGAGWGNLNTINTWWYNVSSTTLPVSINEFRSPQLLVFNQQPPQSYCAGTTGVIFSVGIDPNTEVYHWNYTGTGATITQTNPSDAFVTVDFSSNATPGNITVYGSNANCLAAGPTSSLAVTIKPLPVLNPPYSTGICSGTSPDILLSSSPSGATFSWNIPSPVCSANIQTCPPGQASGTIINDVLSVTNLNSGSVIYFITPTLNSCIGTIHPDTVIVSPLPNVVVNSTTPSICSGQTTNIHLTSSIPSATFTWTAAGSSPNLTGFAPSGTGDILQTISNSGLTNETVTFSILASAGGCAQTIPVLYVVTVYPVPDLLINSTTPSICSGATTNIILSSSVPGASFSWTASGSSPDLTGFAASGSGNILQTITNTGYLTGTVTFFITPAANGCNGIITQYVVTVYPKPDLSNSPLSKSICDSTSTQITLTSHVTGTLFTWVASGSSGNISGFSNNTNLPSALINQVLDNTGYSSATVTYRVIPHANGCNGDTTNYTVTVFPGPDLSNNPPSKSICNNSSTNVTLTSNVAGTNFTWTATGSSPSVTGYSDNLSNPTTTLNQTLHNSGFSNETVTYHMVPHANGCTGHVKDYIVTVFPVPDVYFAPPAQTICSGVTCNISILSHAAGASFTWTASGSSSNVTGFSPGSGNLIQQTLNNASSGIETVTYLVTPVISGCTGTANSVIVGVDPPPSVSLTPCWDSKTITTAQPVKLKGGIPLGGTYTGAGITLGVFYPSLAGTGVHTINYSYTNTFGCTSAANQSITVLFAPNFTCGTSLTDVRDNTAYPTVEIGTQCWMAMNLNYGNTVSSDQMQRDNCVPEKYCYHDMAANCSSYGGLFQWDELMQYDNASAAQGFCPPGWHIPTENEWNTLFSFYISNGFAGSPLKNSGFSGFDAFLSGVRHENAKWDFPDFASFFWSSTAHGQTKAWAHGMNSYNPSVSYYPSLRDNAFSVRCIKD